MLLIDYRQGSVDLIPYVPPELCKKVTLEAGDAMFFGHGPDGQFTLPIGVEYKTVNDAVQSFINKRFVGEQFPKMSNLYKRIYVLVEGEYREGPDGKLQVPYWADGKKKWTSHGWSTTYRAFDNWQNSLTETGKIRFKHSLTRPESATQLLDLYYCWTKDYDSHASLFAFDKSQEPPTQEQPSLKRRMAAQIPHVGWKRSKDADTHFSRIKEMVLASPEEWCKVPGIGKILSKQIVAELDK